MLRPPHPLHKAHNPPPPCAVTGAIDEVRLSKVARADAPLLADAVSQGAESRLTAFGADEQQAGKSHFGFILAAMPLDAWVVVGLLGLMMAAVVGHHDRQGRSYGATSRANAAFIEHFREAAGAPLDRLAVNSTVPAEVRARFVAVAPVRGGHRRAAPPP